MQIQSLRLRAFAFAAGVAVLAVSGWASADPPSRVARLGYTTGAVSFSPAGEDDWVQATINRPLTTGDRLWADAGARAEMQVGGAMIRMSAGTSVAVLNLDDSIAQLQLTQGTLNVHVRRLDPNQVSRSTRRISPSPCGNPATTGSRWTPTAMRRTSSCARARAKCMEKAPRTSSTRGNRIASRGPACVEYQPLAVAGRRRIRSLVERSRPQLRHLGLRPLRIAGRHRLSGPRCERHLARRRRPTATSGSRIAWPPAGRLTATAIGHGSTRGAGRGWMTRPWGFAVSHYGRWTNMRGTWGWVPGPVRSPRLLRAGAGRVRRRQQLPALDLERQRRRHRVVPARAARGLSAVVCR